MTGCTMPLSAQLLRLSESLTSFREEDAFAAIVGTDREAVRAELQRLVADGRLRREGPRFYRARAA